MAENKRAFFIPHLIILAAIAITALILMRPRLLRGNPEGPIPIELPEQLGPYKADNLWFCHNDQCARVFEESKLESAEDGAYICPSCSNSLHEISLGEIKMLPPETPIYRKLYTARARPDIQVTFVFTGAERVSIHRPQICLASQGNRMINEYNYDALIAPGQRMPVRIIETAQEFNLGDGRKQVVPAGFMYWYFNPERHTTSHFARQFWVAYDNALRSYRPRWAYVSITIAMDPTDREKFHDVLDEFLPRLYPLVEKLQADFRALDK